MKFGIPLNSSDEDPGYPSKLSVLTEFLAPFGRAAFALVFLIPATAYFLGDSSLSQSTGLALTPSVEFLLGVLLLGSALSVAVGWYTRVGACAFILFLAPATICMHPFWSDIDPVVQHLNQAFFLRNVSITGAAFLLVYFGAGPMSIDHATSPDR